MTNSTAESTTSETPTPEATTDTGEVVNAVTTDPTSVTVQVSNSTGEDGLGAIAASELQQHGFNVTTPDDYPSPLSSTTVFFSAGNEQAAATVGVGVHRADHRARQREGRHRAGGARVRLLFRQCSSTKRLIGAGTRPSQRREHAYATAGGPRRHQRRRHHLRVAPTAFAVLAAFCLGKFIHRSFTVHAVTIHRISP